VPKLAIVAENPRSKPEVVVAALEPELEMAEAEEGVPPQTLEAFLGNWYGAVSAELVELGVEQVEDLKELEPEEIAQLATKLKPVQARKFVKQLTALHGGGGE
jgi:hypothetical protein